MTKIKLRRHFLAHTIFERCRLPEYELGSYLRTKAPR
jgi:hypothetical protein